MEFAPQFLIVRILCAKRASPSRPTPKQARERIYVFPVPELHANDGLKHHHDVYNVTYDVLAQDKGQTAPGSPSIPIPRSAISKCITRLPPGSCACCTAQYLVEPLPRTPHTATFPTGIPAHALPNNGWSVLGNGICQCYENCSTKTIPRFRGQETG